MTRKPGQRGSAAPPSEREQAIMHAFAEAVGHHQAGRFGPAEALYRRVLGQAPRHAGALHQLGLLAYQCGHVRDAVELMAKAIKVDATVAPFHYSLGNAHKALGELDKAARCYRKALALLPEFSEALNNLGNVLMDLGRRDEAITVYRAVIAQTPNDPDAHINLGLAMMELRRADEAAPCFQTAVDLAPGDSDAQFNLGNALKAMGQIDEAIDHYRRALGLRPDFPAALSNLGNALISRGRLEEAQTCYRQALVFAPNLAEAFNGLGNVFFGQGQLENAVAACRRAIELRPDFAEAYNDLGNALRSLDHHDEALACYNKALSLSPDLKLARHNIAGVLGEVGLAEEAMRCQAAALADGGPDDGVDKVGTLLAHAMYRDDLDSQALRAMHEVFARRYGGKGRLADAAQPRDGRLRVGYLSADLYRGHPVAGNMAPVFREHDRAAFDIRVYYCGSRQDEETQAFRANTDGWRDVAGLSDEAIARVIHADGIDILVCLAGHFEGNRLPVLGWRAAPVQISLHDVVTSGLPETDYIIGDRWLCPPRTDEHFTERRLRLPQFYVADWPEGLPELPAAGRQGPPMFCCFNNPAKIMPQVVTAWGRILADCPEARLLLKYKRRYGSAELRRRFLAIMVAAGAGADQVVFNSDDDDRAAFLGRYNDADIALDTFPFSGSTTTFQALAMGVPVVTWPRDRMVSRWSAAMLDALGLEDLIACSVDDYVAIAVAAAGCVEAWRGRRVAIREALAASRLCRSRSWTRHLERLYRAVWRRCLTQAQGASVSFDAR